MLTLRPVARSGSGLDLRKWDHVYKYEVNGLPVGEEALIAENHHRWQYLRITQGKQGVWTGDYETPEAALKALERILTDVS